MSNLVDNENFMFDSLLNSSAMQADMFYGHTVVAGAPTCNVSLFTDQHGTERPVDLVPTTALVAERIQRTDSNRQMLVLMDTGSNKTFIQQRCLPPGATPLVTNRMQTVTAAGTFTTQGNVPLEGVHLPEFGNSLRLDTQWAHVFHSADTPYDIIVGRDMMAAMGFDIQFSNKRMVCSNRFLPLKPAQTPHLFYLDDDEEFDEDGESWATTLLPAKYDRVSVDKVIAQQAHLNAAQRASLETTFLDCDELFNGKLQR